MIIYLLFASYSSEMQRANKKRGHKIGRRGGEGKGRGGGRRREEKGREGKLPIAS